MPTTKPADQLRAKMRELEVTNATVAAKFGVSVKTVESWLADPKAASHRVMPARYLLMLPLLQ